MDETVLECSKFSILSPHSFIVVVTCFVSGNDGVDAEAAGCGYLAITRSFVSHCTPGT